MKVLIESIVSSISGITYVNRHEISIVFAEMTHSAILETFIRNVRIVVVSQKGDEKYNKQLIQISTKKTEGRLNIDFATILNVGERKSTILKVKIEIGDEIILMHRCHLMKRFFVRSDFEKSLSEG